MRIHTWLPLWILLRSALWFGAMVGLQVFSEPLANWPLRGLAVVAIITYAAGHAAIGRQCWRPGWKAWYAVLWLVNLLLDPALTYVAVVFAANDPWLGDILALFLARGLIVGNVVMGALIHFRLERAEANRARHLANVTREADAALGGDGAWDEHPGPR